jgi:hypothetical protein
METGIVQDMLTNPVGSVKDLVLQIAVMYFLIYKPALWKIQEMRRKKNGGVLARRRSDSTNPLNITATDPGNPGNPGSVNGPTVVAEKISRITERCEAHKMTMGRIETNLKELTNVVHKIDKRVAYVEGKLDD